MKAKYLIAMTARPINESGTMGQYCYFVVEKDFKTVKHALEAKKQTEEQNPHHSYIVTPYYE